MFSPGDPRYDEMLSLATHATQEGLLDRQRPRWRELVTQLLGTVEDAARPESRERRQSLRAALEVEVDILAPEELASLATSSVGSGGLAIRIAEEIPKGTLLELSIKLKERRVPLFVKAQVVWSRDGELGACFIDLYQNDRELLEGVAVLALLKP